MAFQGDSIFWVELDKIVPNPYQPRREFDEAKLKELAESIRMYGVLQPLTVTRRERTRDDGTFFSEYELIAGERRLRASKFAGLAQVPVIIRQGEQTEQEKLELAIIENLQREDLNSVDRALAFQQLTEIFKLTHAQVAAKMGRSREYVSNTLRLLALPKYMLDSLQRAEISEGHARALLMLTDRPEEQDVLFREILLKKISVRESERISRKIATDRVRKKEWKGSDPTLIEYERKLTETLGTRVQIKKTDFGGTVSIDYFDPDDLQKIINNMAKDSTSISSGVASEAVIDTLSEEKEEANEVMAKLSQNTPLEEVLDELPTLESEVIEHAPLPAIDNLVEPPSLDTLVTPPAVVETPRVSDEVMPTGSYEDRFDGAKDLLEKMADTKNEKDDSDMYSIKNFGV